METRLRAAAATIASFAVLLAAVACSGRESAPAALVPVSPGTAVVPPPSVVLAPSFRADQGLAFEARAAVHDRREPDLAVTIDYGDGVSETLLAGPGGAVSLEHRYRGHGDFALTVRAAGPGGETVATATVTVAPRHVVFVQGLNSESNCPGGRRFLDRAPEWIAPYLEGDLELAATMQLDDSNYLYFSYSGAYCDGSDGTLGAAPDYDAGDTCGSIDGRTAPRLRAFIDGLGPGRVTIVAHSMGGIVSAYAIAADPVWALDRIASVVTFDSPLGGVDPARTTVLAMLAVRSDRCGWGSDAIDQLKDGSSVIDQARNAALVVPFYTLDGSGDEPGALGLAEAVKGGETTLPGERLHWQVSEAHSEIWNRTPSSPAGPDKRRFVVCALLDDARCLP